LTKVVSLFLRSHHYSAGVFFGVTLPVRDLASSSLSFFSCKRFASALRTCCGFDCCCPLISRIIIVVEIRGQRQTLCFFALTITPLELFLGVTLRGIPSPFLRWGSFCGCRSVGLASPFLRWGASWVSL